jgi:alkylated DNA repair dioxygenase AlkB
MSKPLINSQNIWNPNIPDGELVYYPNFLNLNKADQISNILINDFNTVLLNHYRDGKDSNGWHADNEKELGVNPVIGSVSLGQERVFHLKHKKNKTDRFKIMLKHGSLLIMSGSMQHNWLHQIPKTSRVINDRINLTFRKIT